MSLMIFATGDAVGVEEQVVELEPEESSAKRTSVRAQFKMIIIIIIFVFVLGFYGQSEKFLEEALIRCIIKDV